jgi:hypothetical protein
MCRSLGFSRRPLLAAVNSNGGLPVLEFTQHPDKRRPIASEEIRPAYHASLPCGTLWLSDEERCFLRRITRTG